MLMPNRLMCSVHSMVAWWEAYLASMQPLFLACWSVHEWVCERVQQCRVTFVHVSLRKPPGV
ncbi:hypothetical protein EMIT0P294_10179 [Pseudomonas sp. IT-P294]